MRLRHNVLAASALLLLWSPGFAAAAPRLPLFDTHVHYSRGAWEVYSPKRILKKLAAAGVKRALVSSTPDEGTLMLYEADPRRIVPNLRPYRVSGDMSRWAWDGEVLAYVTKRIKRGIYKGIGEFHLFEDRDAASPYIKKLARIAVERNIALQVHSGAGPVNVLFSHTPKLKILWAHAGMSEPPGVVGKLLDRYANLWAGVSFRGGDIAPGGKLDPEWRALFLRHPDRFVYGTDTYITERWESYGALVAAHRAWLGQLPRKIAEGIAHRNAVRLFGAGKDTGLPE